MDAAATVTEVRRMQSTLQVFSSLQLYFCVYPEQANVQDGDSFDFIIVGGGSAGSILANRLTENEDANVLLIEEGGDPPIDSMIPGLFAYLPSTRSDKNYTSENDNRTQQFHRNHVANLTCGNMLGGGSSINYMAYVRGNYHDYDSWAAATNDSSWSWNSVLPYFIKCENQRDPEILNSSYRAYHGTDGYIGVTRRTSDDAPKYFDALKESGEDVLLDINGERQVGYTEQMFTIADGLRQSPAYVYLASAKSRRNLNVLKNTRVTKIIFDENNNAIGVNATTSDDQQFFFRATKEVVLSAGSFNSPKLLMLSGIGPKEHLENLAIPVRSDLPVGHNYHDHVTVFLSFKMEKSNAPPEEANLRDFPLPVITGYVALNKSQTYPDYQAHIFIVPNDSKLPMQLCAFNFWLNYEICQKLYDAGKGRNTLFTLFNLIYPKSRGRVSLRSADPLDAPVVVTGIFSDETDLENMVSYVEHFVRIFNTSYFQRVGAELADLTLECAEFERGSREYWRCYILSAMSALQHFAGTCAMNMVVDSQLRVFGVQKLRVVDASIMPTIVGGNTNAPVMMIAEKAADMIKQEYYEYGTVN